MKVFTKKQTNVIETSDTNAPKLMKITNSGYFVYSVTYFVDAVKAMKNNAIVVKILGTTRPSIRNNLNLLANNNPDVVINNILQKNSKSKDKFRSQKGNIFFTYNSDITSIIPNDKTHILMTNPTRLANETEIRALKIDREFALRDSDDLLSQNIVMPVFQNNIAENVLGGDTDERNTSAAKKVSEKMILGGAIEPATVSGARTNTIQSAKKVSSGIVSLPSRMLASQKLTGEQKRSLFNGLVNTTNPSTNLQLKNPELLGVVVKKPVAILKMENC